MRSTTLARWFSVSRYALAALCLLLSSFASSRLIAGGGDDTTPPTLSPMQNITSTASSPAGAFVGFALPTATDDDSGVQSVSCDRQSGSFPFGVTTVTCTATDVAGNSSSGTFTVTVNVANGHHLLTINMVGLGNPPLTGVVGIVPLALLCNNPDASEQCVFQIPAGTALRLNGNAPFPSTPAVFSAGSGAASACFKSTCTLTMNGPAEVTATFDGGAPVNTISINLTGAGPGEVFNDNSRCQNYDHDLAHLPTQYSSCVQAYAPGSGVLLQAWPPAGSRFNEYSEGTGTAAVCGAGPNCSFALHANESVTARFSAVTSIKVTPENDTISINQSRQFTATGTYNDLSTQVIQGNMGTWKTRTSMGQIRFNHAMAAAGGRVYALGGINGSAPGSSLQGSVEAYDPASNTWSPRQGTSARSGAGAATVDDRYIYVVGGNAPGGCPMADLDVYDTLTDTWSARAPMPGGPRRNVSAAVVGRKLYAIGGELNVCGETSGVELKSVEVYDVDTNQWSTAPDMSAARSFNGVGVIDGVIYAVGGSDGQGNLANVEAYNPATNTWTARAPMPSGRSLHAVAVVNDILYAVGGNNGGYLSSMVAYDPSTNAWSNKAWLPQVEEVIGPNSPHGFVAGQRAELAAATLDGIVYVSGGLVSDNGAAQLPPVGIVFSFVDSLVWSSSDTAVATIVNNNQTGFSFGRATGLQAGVTTIGATAGTVTCATAPGACATLTVTDTVANSTPAVTIFGMPQGSPAITINAGQSISRNGNFFDPDQGQTWTATVNYGDNTGQQTLNIVLGTPPNGPAGTFSLSHSYSQAGVYAATVRVTDNLGGFGTATLTVTVNAPTPQINLNVPNQASTEAGDTEWWGCVTVNGSNLSGPWTTTIDYGDGSVQNVSLLIPPSGPCAQFGQNIGVFTLDHVYNLAGNYQVTVTVTNSGVSATRVFTVRVDPPSCVPVSSNFIGHNVPSLMVHIRIFDGVTGAALGEEDLPLGMTNLGTTVAGSYRLELSVPPGYAITPSVIEFTGVCGQPFVLTANITAADTTAPAIVSVVPNTTSLWPPNHKMVPVSIAVTATDAVDATPACSITDVTSNEAVGATSPDWQFNANSLLVNLRAERDSMRIYTITVTCRDDAGNSSSATTTVTVPHDKGK